METLNGNLEKEPGEKPPNHVGTEEENRETNENIRAPSGSWWVSKDYVAGDKPPNPVENRGGKPDKGSIDEKPPNRWKGRRGKPKDL